MLSMPQGAASISGLGTEMLLQTTTGEATRDHFHPLGTGCELVTNPEDLDEGKVTTRQGERRS